MDILPLIVIYLITFRLAIIVAGIIAIYLGYKLFIKGFWPEHNDKEGTSFDAKIVGSHFKLKNAAPGTFFALFGVIIIAIMLIIGSPEFISKDLKSFKQQDVKSGNSEKVESAERHIYLRSSDISTVNRIKQDFKNGYITAEQAYKELLIIIEKK